MFLNTCSNSRGTFPKQAKNAIMENGVPGGNDVPGWHSRGYLPHFEGAEATQHVTFHLADSLPKTVLLQLEAELKTLPEEKRDAERRKRIDAWIDAGHGSCILRNPAIAGMAQQSLLRFDAERYRLLAWVVMPNHIHVLFQPMNGWSVAKIVASWKKFTASKICDHRLHTGEGPRPPIWHREYWDRYIRNQDHFQQAIDYIHLNPVKAGLAATPEAWPWSSAFAGNANLRIGEQQTPLWKMAFPAQNHERATLSIRCGSVRCVKIKRPGGWSGAWVAVRLWLIAMR